jgi:metal-sulfur cluster biosynthetic enzyme
MRPNEEEVWRALSGVLDPELDESIVDLGFVTKVEATDAAVAVSFRLPTAWCSPNFAWMMAEDIRSVLAGLGWVERSKITLVDHFASARINGAIAAGDDFQSAFGEEAGGNLDKLRARFREKAFLGRMAGLIRAIEADDVDPVDLANMSIADVEALCGRSPVGNLAARYLELRRAFGGPTGSEDRAFVRPDGSAIEPGGLKSFLREIRLTRHGVEANGEFCRALLKARNEAPIPETA